MNKLRRNHLLRKQFRQNTAVLSIPVVSLSLLLFGVIGHFLALIVLSCPAFRCICAKGYERDQQFSDFDNCMKNTVIERYAEIDGRPVVHCGSFICLNNGTCVTKTLVGESTYNITKVVSETRTTEPGLFDATEVCQCPVGFIGPSCDVEENTWAGEFKHYLNMVTGVTET